MQLKKQSIVQLGKQGLTDNFFLTLENNFKTHENVKIIVLKGAGHDREKIKEFNQEILNKLGNKYTSRILGFTIFLKKWRRAVR
ncbi:MAG: YhbY family RNA-binding protein [Nanoarchaeota archaeon]